MKTTRDIDLLRKLDIFGQSVQLTFRNESKYKTSIGGIASIFYITVLTVLIAIKALQFTDVENAHIQITNSMDDDDEPLELFKLNYRFAVEQIDQRVGQFQAWQADWPRGGNRTFTPIELIDCQEFVNDERWAIFLGDTRVQDKLNRGTQLLCPNVDSLEVQGQYEDEHFSYIQISLQACDSTIEGNQCFDAAEVSNRAVNFLILQSQVDFSERNPDDIIKYYVDRSNFVMINSLVSKQLDIFYKKSKITTDDKIFKLFSSYTENKQQTFEFYNRY